MPAATKRKTSLTLDGHTLDEARELNLNVSAIAEAALVRAVAEQRHKQWLEANAEAFKAQAEWHEKHGHPLAHIAASPWGKTWSR